MNLSREVMAADKAVEQLQGGRHSSPLITDSVNPVNLISEGMTAEEAAAIRMNRLQPSSSLHSQEQTTTTTEKEVNNQEVDNTTMTSPNKAMIISEGMTAEEAQQTRMARLHQTSSSTALPPPTTTKTTTATTIKKEEEEVVPIMTNKPISSIPQKNNNRGVSGLKQALIKHGIIRMLTMMMMMISSMMNYYQQHRHLPESFSESKSPIPTHPSLPHLPELLQELLPMK